MIETTELKRKRRNILVIVIIILIILTVAWTVFFVHTLQENKTDEQPAAEINSSNGGSATVKNTSLMYKIIAIVIAILGFIAGIVCWIKIEIDKIGFAIMIGVWIGTLLSVLIYFGIEAILANQESILYILNKNDNNSATTASNNVPFADDNSNVDYEHIETLNKILNDTESNQDEQQ